MIIIKLQGGLGNQMFQYAVGRALSLKYGTDLVLDISFYAQQDLRAYALDSFSIAATVTAPTDISAYKVIQEKAEGFDPMVLDAGENVYLEGYWQSEKYFKDIASTIKKEFLFKEPPSADFKKMFAEMQAITSVSLHLRRGDYLSPKHQNIYAQLQPSYYEQAAATIAKQAGPLRLFVFSDDSAWVRENLSFPLPIEYVSGKGFTDSEELALMSACAHNVIANSSFSWWGAWLNSNPEKIVIAPEKWFIDGRSEADLIPPTWKRI